MLSGSEGNHKELRLSRGDSRFSNVSLKSLNWKVLPEDEVWKIFADMARGVQHVHDKGFVHLDIKPDNFFVTKDRTVKLGDFGKAVHVSVIDELIDDEIEGDTTFMASEVLNRRLGKLS